MGGWETIEMVQKYAHINARHLLKYANQVKFSSNLIFDPEKLFAENEKLEESLENKKAVSY